MKIAIILNGISVAKKNFYRNVLPALQQSFLVDVFETRSQQDAPLLSSQAVDKKFDVIIAAGGDGTVHQVVNGMLEGREPHHTLPALVVYPLGTGNDFARSLNIYTDSNQLISLLTNFKVKQVDVGIVTFTNTTGESEGRYFVNVADVGMGPEVVKRVLNSKRLLGSGVSYYLAILSTFFKYKPVEVTATASGWNWQGKLRTLAIANGNFYGHGLCIAPDAKPDDGIFESFICGDASTVDFILQSNNLRQGKYIKHPKVVYNKTKDITLQSTALCSIEADGEWLGTLPATVKMAAHKIQLLAP